MTTSSPQNVPATTGTPKAPLLTSAQYDKLKAFNQFVLPAVGTLYAALAIIWGFPHGKEVVGSIAAITIFLGVILGWASKRYNDSDEKYDGEMIVHPDPDVVNSLSFNVPLSELENQNQITLKVVPKAP